jgi:hypothetical protein
MAIEEYSNVDGIECVYWVDEQGEHSMTKTAYLESLNDNTETE